MDEIKFMDNSNHLGFPETPKPEIRYETLNGEEYYWFFGKRRWKFQVEEDQKKEYIKRVIECFMNKYGMNYKCAKKVFRKSFLYSSLKHHTQETLHDDIETNVDNIYKDYIKL